jgi:hypothetical protein
MMSNRDIRFQTRDWWVDRVTERDRGAVVCHSIRHETFMGRADKRTVSLEGLEGRKSDLRNSRDQPLPGVCSS